MTGKGIPILSKRIFFNFVLRLARFSASVVIPLATSAIRIARSSISISMGSTSSLIIPVPSF